MVRKNFDRLSEKNRRDDTSDDRCQPLLGFDIPEFDSSDDDEEERDENADQRKTVGNEQTPPGQCDGAVLVLLHRRRRLE